MVKASIYIFTLFFWVFPFQHLIAQTCPADIEKNGITFLADKVWSQRTEAQISTMTHGFDLSKNAVSGRFQSLNIEGRPEFSLSDNAAHEYSGGAILSFELGGLKNARKALVSADKDNYLAQMRVERWAFIDNIQNRYLRWRTHELERSHLEEYANETATELVPIRKARSRMLISKIDLSDLEVELARIHAELAEATLRSKHAQARLFAALGVECRLPKVKKIDFPKENPWASLLQKVLEFPEVKGLESLDRKFSLEAQLRKKSSPWVLNAGIGLRSTNDSLHLGPVLSLTIPLQNNHWQAHLSEARSVSSRMKKQQSVQRIEKEMIAEGERYDSLLAQYFSLDKKLLTPLKERSQLYEAGFKASQITLERLIRARRDLHEGEHKMLLKYAEIEGRILKSIAIERLLKSTQENK